MNAKLLGEKYNLEEIDKKLGEKYWSPVDVAFVNDWVLKSIPKAINTLRESRGL